MSGFLDLSWEGLAQSMKVQPTQSVACHKTALFPKAITDAVQAQAGGWTCVPSEVSRLSDWQAVASPLGPIRVPFSRQKDLTMGCVE